MSVVVGRGRTLLNRVRARLDGRTPRFATRDVQIGAGVRFGRNVVFNSRRVRIGDGVVFGDNVRVDAERFEIGDLGTIYDYCFFPGPGTIRIGHNFWMGNGAIVDAAGGTDIGNNVCVGVRSQVWTHMRFGDVLLGCRFHSVRPVTIEDDVWISSACLISPVRLETMSVALAGAVVTRPMKANRCYAGVPAEDVTGRLGAPFVITTTAERAAMLRKLLEGFVASRAGVSLEQFRIIAADQDGSDPPIREDVMVFNVADRTYRKRGTALEREVLRHLLPDAKFVPR